MQKKVKCMIERGSSWKSSTNVYAVLRRNAKFIVGLFFKVMSDTRLFKFCEPAVGFLKKRGLPLER